jgi:uncharacterized protein YbbC (DUF1343 family)
MFYFYYLFMFFVLFLRVESSAAVQLGVDVFFSEKVSESLKGKRVGLITNHTGVSQDLTLTYELFLKNQTSFDLVAIFSPEHGLFGQEFAAKECKDHKIQHKVPVISLYGETKRPTSKMLEGIDVLIYDIQDVGSRPYTYATTLYYVMEEAAKKGIEVVVLDRPNPLSGMLIDGPLLEDGVRSYTGYIDVPYCHGMTIGELARFFNGEYATHCKLRVVPMKGWKRSMFFKDTGLSWIPTSPYIPESDTPLFYATTGLIGELSFLSIGVGYTLPFKVIGAPWINGQALSKRMNDLKIPGVHFLPFHFKPLYGLYKGELCQGFLIVILDHRLYKPIRVQHYILGVIKGLYPKIVEEKLKALSKAKKKMFCDAAGGDKILSIFFDEKYPASKMVQHQTDKRQEYLEKRKKYLLYN